MGKRRKCIRYTLSTAAVIVAAVVLYALFRTDKGEPVVISLEIT